MTKPSDNPQEWADDASADKVDPTTFAAVGFVADDPARYDWLNWVLNNFGAWLDFLRSGGGEVYFAPAGLAYTKNSTLPFTITTGSLDATLTNTGGGTFSADGVSSPVNAPGTAVSVTLEFGSNTSISSGATVTPTIFWYSGGTRVTASFNAASLTVSGAQTDTVTFLSGTASLGAPWTLQVEISIDAGDRVHLTEAIVNLS